jgi:hypothetical protein
MWTPNKFTNDQYNKEINYLQLDSNISKHNKKSHKKSKKMHKKSKSNVQLGRYSDELANGDASDDRELHEDEDANDDVVDFNGHDNKGYAARDVVTARESNHINGLTSLGSGHFMTHPSLMQ